MDQKVRTRLKNGGLKPRSIITLVHIVSTTAPTHHCPQHKIHTHKIHIHQTDTHGHPLTPMN